MKIAKYQELTDEELAAIGRECFFDGAPPAVIIKIQLLIEKYKELRQHHIDETTELWRRLRAKEEPATDADPFVVPTRIVVEPTTFEQILKLIENPPPPTAAMIELFKRQP